MGGLKNFFLKLTPIMLLICCICYGILHTFQQQNSNRNITYLTQESINIGTEEQPEYKTLYTFDMVSYTQNIDQNILKRSVSKTFDLNAFSNVTASFNNIWNDGYQLFDISKTLVNAVIVVIDGIIFTINIALTPLRIISGIILTGMSIVGININNGRIITPFLTWIVDKASIPLINPTYTSVNEEDLNNSIWQMSNEPQTKYYKKTINPAFIEGPTYTYTNFDINVSFKTDETLPNHTRVVCSRISTEYIAGTNNFTIHYHSASYNGGTLKVYDQNNNGWIDDVYKTLYFDEDITETMTQTDKDQLQIFLSNATKLGNYIE